MKRFWLIGLLFALPFLLYGGCETMNTNVNYVFGFDQLKPDSMELSELQFEDVPVPKEFHLVTEANESYSFESMDFRSGNLSYVGSGFRRDIVDYYKHHMRTQRNGWQEVNHATSGREDTLSFRKNNYECIIRVKEKGGELHLSVLMNTIS